MDTLHITHSAFSPFQTFWSCGDAVRVLDCEGAALEILGLHGSEEVGVFPCVADGVFRGGATDVDAGKTAAAARVGACAVSHLAIAACSSIQAANLSKGTAPSWRSVLHLCWYHSCFNWEGSLSVMRVCVPRSFKDGKAPGLHSIRVTAELHV